MESSVALKVIKEGTGNIVYTSGCVMEVSCNHTKYGEERIAIYKDGEACDGLGEIGDVYPSNYVGGRETILCIKISVPGRGVLWIEKTHYNANIANCEKCCNPITQLAEIENLTAAPDDAEVVLNWDDTPNATSYEVERATDNGFSDAANIYSGTTSGLTDNTGLTNGTTYYYRVRAVASGYNKSEWAVISATPNYPQLAQPGNFVAVSGDTQNALDWDDTPNATSYTVERDTTSDFAAPTSIYTGAASTYTDTGLTNGTTYYYRVKATAANYLNSPLAYVNQTPSA